MSTVAQTRAARKVLAYRQQIIQDLDAELHQATTLTLVMVLELMRRRGRQQKSGSEAELALEIARRAQKGNPRQVRLL